MSKTSEIEMDTLVTADKEPDVSSPVLDTSADQLSPGRAEDTALLPTSDIEMDTLVTANKESKVSTIGLNDQLSPGEAEDTALLPMSPSGLERNQEIDETFGVDGDFETEVNSLLEGGEVPTSEHAERQSNALFVEMFRRILELCFILGRNYIEFVIFGFIMLLLLFLGVFVLPNCFHSLYYDEYALSRSSLTGKVDDTQVYEPGWHFMSPFNEWIKFYKTAHNVKFTNLKIYTTDQLMIRVSFSVYYFLDKKSIGQLYRKLGTNYESVIQKVCKSELLNAAQEFDITKFRSDRATIKKHLKERVSTRLQTNYGINLFDLYMENIHFDKLINDLSLKRILNDLYTEKAASDKETAIIYKQTEVIVTVINNQAYEFNRIAKDNSTYEVMKIEQAKYDKVIELTHIDGLTENFEELNIADMQQKISFSWFNSLVYNEKIKYYQPNSYADAKSQLSPYHDTISLMV